jgi:D-glycero-D-manno-heptose 1,7-bisphosphate phosphatase
VHVLLTPARGYRWGMLQAGLKPDHALDRCYHNGVFKLKSKFAFGISKSDGKQPDPGPVKPVFNSVRTVFLDRDGILNEKMPEGLYVSRWIDFQVLPGVPEALRQLNEAGLLVIVVTNQRGIAQGLYAAEDVDAIHASFRKLLAGWGARVDAFFICPHEIGKCDCRKPLPGLFHQAVAKYPNIKVADSVMIGDSLSDIEFGKQLGMKTILVEGNPQYRAPGAEEAAKLADLRVASLTEATDQIVGLKA